MLAWRQRKTQFAALLGFLALLPLTAAPAGAQATNWTGTLGNWSLGSNWSAGEPNATVDAVFNQLGTATVNMTNESCRNLLIGNDGVSASVTVQAPGTLAVVGSIRVPYQLSGAFNHQSGLVTCDSLLIGNVPLKIGQYLMQGGNLTVGTVQMGMVQNSAATFSIGGLNTHVSVGHSLYVGRGGNLVSGGGTFTVGSMNTDSLVVIGSFQMVNQPTVNVTNFVLRNLSGITYTFLPTGITPVISSGALILDGTLTVFDAGAPNGTYEILRGNSISGTFDTVTLPLVGDWSWRIDGNSVFVSKGIVAVEPTTWSDVKTRSVRN
ncbi:MAG TPA: hypothetical protein VF720_02310 [Candidatus Eisenbacteria bacterium]